MSKEDIILGYVKDQYQTANEIFKVVDSRVGNYLLITGLFWGILVQIASPLICFLRDDYDFSFCVVMLQVTFIFANLCLISTVLAIVFIFTAMRIAIPGCKTKEEYLKVIDSDLVAEKDIVEGMLGNYTQAYRENLQRAAVRSDHFRFIRICMITGIISTVLCIFIFGCIKIHTDPLNPSRTVRCKNG